MTRMPDFEYVQLPVPTAILGRRMTSRERELVARIAHQATEPVLWRWKSFDAEKMVGRPTRELNFSVLWRNPQYRRCARGLAAGDFTLAGMNVWVSAIRWIRSRRVAP